MTWGVLLAAVAFSLLTTAKAGVYDELVLKPPEGKTGAPLAWLVLPGAEIKKEAYKPLAEAVQAAVERPLWVAVLGAYLTPSPIPAELGPRIDHVLNNMKSKGLELSSVKLFYGGHSLGCVFIQDHLSQYFGATGPLNGSVDIIGQVLMGGFVQRKYKYPSWTYPVSTLTIGGELDGLARPTRLAEAFYASQINKHTANSSVKTDFPVVFLKGVSHMQFASGDPPLLVKLRDLQPEVSESAAHQSIAQAISAYMAIRIGAKADASFKQLQDSTSEFLKPIIHAYELEGGRSFNMPDQFGGPGEKNCGVYKDNGLCPSSSAWVPKVQEMISGGIGEWKLNISNAYVNLASMPLTGGKHHLPRITSDPLHHTISITTWAQNNWDDAKPSWFGWREIFDVFDTGLVATSAEEIGAKLASRQCTMLNATLSNVSFDVDDPDFCMEANQKAYEWAKSQAGAVTLDRYQKKGEQLTFAKDVPKLAGPLWIKERLSFTERTLPSGAKVIDVASPMLKTDVDYWNRHFHIPRPASIPDPGCVHYCKLLSPARAMEWIYVDSLRGAKSLLAQEDMQTIVV